MKEIENKFKQMLNEWLKDPNENYKVQLLLEQALSNVLSFADGVQLNSHITENILVSYAKTRYPADNDIVAQFDTDDTDLFMYIEEIIGKAVDIIESQTSISYTWIYEGKDSPMT